jgi:hypothetical protein
MSTTTTTSKDLRERLVDAEQELQDAERAIGSVVLDGGNEQAASARVSAARAAVERLQCAHSELDDRAADREAAEQERQDAVARWRYVAWHAEYVKRIEPVLSLRAELDAAEEQVIALGSAHSATGRSGDRGVHERWLEQERQAGRLPLIEGLPHEASVSGDENRYQRRQRAQEGNLTAEECAEWAEQLAPLVEQAAKELGADAKPENLPWTKGA